MEEKQPFVLYDYLLYFWRKKIFFLIIPIITVVVAVGAVYMVKNEQPYTAVGRAYVGSLTEKTLTDPDNIKANLKGVKDIDVFVSEKGQVKFVLRGESEAAVESELETIMDKYLEDLKKQYNIRLEASTVYLEDLERIAEKLTPEIELYKSELQNGDLNDSEYTDTTKLIISLESDLADAQKTAHKMRSDLVFFEEPKLYETEAHRTNNFVKEAAAVGIVLGLVFSVLVLMLMKYIGEARRYYRK